MSAQTGAPRHPRAAARALPPPLDAQGAALLMPALWSPEPHCGRSPPCDGHPGPRLSHARGCPAVNAGRGRTRRAPPLPPSLAVQALMMAARRRPTSSRARPSSCHLRRLVTDGAAELIINSFTLSGVALLCGKAHGIPVAGFCAQPSSIPSDDAHWRSVIPIDSWGSAASRSSTSSRRSSSPRTRRSSRCASRARRSRRSLPALRQRRPRGLEDVEGRLPRLAPVVICRRPSSALRLARLLRHHRLHLPALGDAGRRHAAPPIAAFTDAARRRPQADGDDVLVMPVPRTFALGAAVEMLEKSKHDFSLLYVGKRQPVAVPEADERRRAPRGGGQAARGRARRLWRPLPPDGRVRRPRRAGDGRGADAQAGR